MVLPYIGEIRMFAGSYRISGWAFCDGQLMAISENDALFQRIGTTYGGDGEETFALPNLNNRIPMHVSSSHPLGETGGQESVTLTTQQIPVHSHPFLVSNALANQPTPGGNMPAQSGAMSWYRETGGSQVAMAPQQLAPAGGSQPHENMVPFLVVTFQISLFGVYPTPTP